MLSYNLINVVVKTNRQKARNDEATDIRGREEMYQKVRKGWLKHVDFILLDLICVQVAFVLAFVIRHGMSNPYVNSDYLAMAFIIEFADIAAMMMGGTMSGIIKRGFYREFAASFKNGFLMVAIVMFYVFATQKGETYSRITLLLMGVLYVCLTFCVRLLWRRHLHIRMRQGKGKKLLVVTTQTVADEVLTKLRATNYSGFDIAGVILVDADAKGSEILGVPVVANYSDGADYVRTGWVDEIFVDVRGAYVYAKDLIGAFVEAGVTVHLCISSMMDAYGESQIIQKFGGETVVTTSINYATAGQMFLKRCLDVIGGLVGSVITLLLTIFIGPAIYIKSPGPIFFKQERVGLNGKTFKMYKFRSMYLDAEERKAELMAQNTMGDTRMFKMDFDPRVIGNEILPDGTQKKGLGQFLRDSSLDEFPQFFNVLKGDLSLVGTRPPLMSEVNEYEMHHKSRLSIKPGITGMWQVSGRSDITDFEEVVRLDGEYISNWSFGLDIKILLKTVGVVLGQKGSK